MIPCAPSLILRLNLSLRPCLILILILSLVPSEPAQLATDSDGRGPGPHVRK